MKFNKNFSKITIIFLILISNFAQIYLTNTNLNKKRTKTNTKTNIKSRIFVKDTRKFLQQKIGLKAFNLLGAGQLITRCPRYSVLVKMVFEKRNDHILDVGFNCRRDYKNISDDEITLPKENSKVISNTFDQLTPPKAECPEGRLLSGYEFQRMGKITYFKYYCTKVKNMHDKQVIKDKMYPATQVLDSLERKSFSRFLPHTDITVNYGKYQNYGINFLNFKRDEGVLSYSFAISKIGTPPAGKKDP